MHKGKIYVLLVLAILFLSSCGKNGKKKEPTPTGEPVNPSESMGTVTPSTDPGAETKEPLPETTHRLTWVVSGFFRVSEENAYKINRMLYDAGLDCRVDFVSDNIPTNLNTWLKEYSEVHGMPDIMHSGTWSGYDDSAMFLKEYFIPITSFLKDDPDGKTLWKTFPEIDWERVRLDGEIYSVPYLNEYSLSYYNMGLYVSVREEFTDNLGQKVDFVSLRALQAQVGSNQWKIAIPAVELSDLYGLAGFQTWHGELPYCSSEQRLIDPSESEEIEEVLDEVYKGLSDGSIIDPTAGTSDSSAAVLAEYYIGIRAPRDGYTDYPVSKDTYFTNTNLTTGVLKDSLNKELACKVLAFCISNPDIVELIYPAWKNRDAIAERKNLLSEEEKTELTGFVPTLPKDQRGHKNAFLNDLSAFESSMYLTSYNSAQGKVIYTLAKGFHAKAVLSSFGTAQNKAIIQTIEEEWEKYKEQR